MVLGIAIGVVLFIIYEKQRVSAPIDGEIDGFQDISNVNESNYYSGKLVQDYHLQSNENRGAKTCLHKYVDIGHFQGGIKMNKDTSALLFCTKDGYPNSHPCPGNTCNTCISYKKDFQTINSETNSKYNTLNKSIEDQKEVFEGLDVPIQSTVLALEGEIYRRKLLVDKVKANIEEAQELEASIGKLKIEKKLYDDAESYCKTQPNSIFYRNIKARKNKPGRRYIDMAESKFDSIKGPSGDYKCWSNHKIPQILAIYGAGTLPSYPQLKATETKPLGTVIKVGNSGEWLVATPLVHDILKRRNEKKLEVTNSNMTPKGTDPDVNIVKDLVIYIDDTILYRIKERTDFTVAQQRFIRSLLYGEYINQLGDCAFKKDISKYVTTLNKCVNTCNRNRRCQGFSYNQHDSRCILKHDKCSKNPDKSSNFTFYEKPAMILRPELN